MSDLFEKLDIETPEQISLEFPLAGLGSRSLAFLFDSLIQFIIVFIATLILAYYSSSLATYWSAANNWIIAAMVFAGFCLYWGYFAAFEIFWNGQTPGKRHAKIRVISASGRPITAFEGVARNFLRAIDSMFFYGIGIIAIAIDRQNRRLGDMVAGTVVVHETAEIEDTMWYSNSARQPTSVGDVAGTVTAAEFQLIEAFLARRIDLTPEARHQAAASIADRLGSKLGLDRESRPSDEDFLEDVAHNYRDQARFNHSR